MKRICMLCGTGILGIIAGCSSDAQTGAAVGAGTGALAGQAIGRNTESTLIGAGVGAAAGYIIGNESDKQKAREADEQRRRELAERRRREQQQAEREQAASDAADSPVASDTPGASDTSGASDSTDTEQAPVIVQQENLYYGEWTFQGTGATEQEALRSARGRARKAIYDRVESWADRSRARARQEFRLRNSTGFSSHFSLAADAMLDSWSPDIVVNREPEGRWIATIRIDSANLEYRYREYLSEASAFVDSGDRAAFRNWCRTMRLS